jgi:hypothetical protein
MSDGQEFQGHTMSFLVRLIQAISLRPKSNSRVAF